MCKLARRVSSAQAKAEFSALVARVAYGGEHVIIERHGKAVAALVSIADLERIEGDLAPSGKPQGFFALVGAWGDLLADEEIDEMVAHLYAEREEERGRAVELED